MTERPKQNEDEGHGIGLAGLNKIQDIQDIIARTAGSSSQSQPDPSLRARMFGLLTAALGGERQRAPRCPKPKDLHTKPKPEPKGAQVLSPSKRGPSAFANVCGAPLRPRGDLLFVPLGKRSEDLTCFG